MRYFVAHEETPTAYSMNAEPLPSYTAAMEVLVREEAQRPPRATLIPVTDEYGDTQMVPNMEHGSRGRILLDLGSLEYGGELARAIRLDDPVLAAIYRLGYDAGRAEEAANDRV